MNYNIVLIGSGNLATQLSLAIKQTSNNIMQVYSRTEIHAKELADKLGCGYTSKTEDIIKDADAYIISVKDDAVSKLAETICAGKEDAVFMHTAGSVPMSVFDNHATHYGVLYPMQSFSKTRNVNFKVIPCFTEANDSKSMKVIRDIAESISDEITDADTEKRKKIHLAAVMASNLANHCYRLGEKVLETAGIDFNILLPLILETARKVTEMSPRDAQTGPMVRYDTGVMSKQIKLLEDERTREIYRLMAESIHEDSTHKENGK